MPNSAALIAIGFSSAEASVMVTESNTPVLTVIQNDNYDPAHSGIGTQSGTIVTATTITRPGTIGSMSWTLEGEMVEFADCADALYDKVLRLSDFPQFGVRNYRLISLPFYDYAPSSYMVGLESESAGDFKFPGACLIGGSQWEVRKTLITPVQDHFSHWLVSQGGGGTRNQNVGGSTPPPNNVSLSCIRSDGVEVLNPPPKDLVLANIPQADDESPYSWSFYRYGFPPLPDPAIPGLVTCNA